MSEPLNGRLGEARGWLEGIGFTVTDEALWLEALTHGSTAIGLDYQRLEFLGDRAGPDHAALFTVRVSVAGVGEVEATASSKQDAETAAAKKFMEKYG